MHSKVSSYFLGGVRGRACDRGKFYRGSYNTNAHTHLGMDTTASNAHLDAIGAALDANNEKEDVSVPTAGLAKTLSNLGIRLRPDTVHLLSISGLFVRARACVVGRASGVPCACPVNCAP